MAWGSLANIVPPDTTLPLTAPTVNEDTEHPSSSSLPPGGKASAAAPPSRFRGQWHPQASWQQIPPWERHANHEGELVCSAKACDACIKSKAPSSQKRHWAGASISLDRSPVCRRDAASRCPSRRFELASDDTVLYDDLKKIYTFNFNDGIFSCLFGPLI